MKRTESLLRWSVVLLLLGVAPVCSRAESVVRVHMIDARTGQPIASEPVRLWTTYVAEYRDHPGYVQQMTDSNGVATFHVPDPQPAYLYVHTGMRGAWQECSSNNRTGYVAKDVLQSGVSSEGFCAKLPDISAKFHPAAGDVYIFVQHNGFFQRLKPQN